MLLAGLLPMVALAAAPPSELVIGGRMPELRGEYLTGREAVLPEAGKGKVSLLLLGFTYESRFSVEAWAKRFRDQFGSDPRVSFYEVPMISGMARLGKWFIDSGMRRGTPKEDYEHVITVYRGVNEWKRRVRFGDQNVAYMILIDPAGKVSWRHQGRFEEGAYKEFSSQVSELLKSIQPGANLSHHGV